MSWSGTGPRPEVAVVYYPHWHVYDHGSSWLGEGWTEWQGMAAALPRFPGHRQPLECTWGAFDESDPAWVAREIDLAADHGIDVFLYDWYWYSGVRNMEEALEQGFLQAPNRDRLKFCLMWANHDRRNQFCPEHTPARNVWLPSRHSPRDLDRVIDYCSEHYFSQPNYWRVAGGLYLSIFEPVRMVAELGGPAATRAIFAAIDRRLDQAGLPPIHWNGMSWSPTHLPALTEAGFASVGSYNIASAGQAGDDGTEPYEAVMAAHLTRWAQMSSGTLPYVPVATMGWDASPRCRADVPWPFPQIDGRHHYPYVPVVVGNTPERFEQLLRDAAAHVDQAPIRPPAVLLYAWNEWTEGGYLLPERHTGTAYLEAVKAVFGVRS